MSVPPAPPNLDNIPAQLRSLPAYRPLQGDFVYDVDNKWKPWWSVVVVRRGIEALQDESSAAGAGSEYKRYIAALRGLMNKTEPGKSYSAYMACATYHHEYTENGQNEDELCMHRNESFAAWHRAYISNVEWRLREMDRELGGNGCIGHPYWNAVTMPVPDAMHQEFPNNSVFVDSKGQQVIPDWWIARGRDGWVVDRIVIRHGDHLKGPEDVIVRADDNFGDKKNRTSLQSGWQETINSKVKDNPPVHSTFIPILEGVHNGIHAYLDSPMAYVPTAAVDPIFYLHHCNIDRLFQEYIQNRTVAVVTSEWKNSTGENDDDRKYDKEMVPFTLPRSYKVLSGDAQGQAGQPFEGSHCFNTANLGYLYLPADLPDVTRVGPRLLRAPQDTRKCTMLIRNIKIADLHGVPHYFLAFVVKNGEQFVPPANPAAAIRHVNFADTQVTLTRKVEECRNCQKQPPLTLALDVTAYLREHGLTHLDVTVEVMLAIGGVNSPLVPLRDTAFNDTKFVTPLFVDDNVAGASEPEVVEAQKILKKQGFLAEGFTAGVIDEATKKALTQLQAASGIPNTEGLIDRNTKYFLTCDRPCEWADRPNPPCLGDFVDVLRGRTRVLYTVLDTNGLPVKKLREEVDAAFREWSRAFQALNRKVTFARTDTVSAADIVVGFARNGTRPAMTGNTPPVVFDRNNFEGRPSTFASIVQVDNQMGIFLDAKQDWVFVGDEIGFQQFRLMPVLLHEIGHLLGLRHGAVHSAMSAYYEDGQITVTDDDIEMLRRVE